TSAALPRRRSPCSAGLIASSVATAIPAALGNSAVVADRFTVPVAAPFTPGAAPTSTSLPAAFSAVMSHRGLSPRPTPELAAAAARLGSPLVSGAASSVRRGGGGCGRGVVGAVLPRAAGPVRHSPRARRACRPPPAPVAGGLEPDASGLRGDVFGGFYVAQG